MSPRRCTKKAYRDHAEAVSAVHCRQRPTMPGQVDERAGYLRVYECHLCGFFHLTSQLPKYAAAASG